MRRHRYKNPIKTLSIHHMTLSLVVGSIRSYIAAQSKPGEPTTAYEYDYLQYMEKVRVGVLARLYRLGPAVRKDSACFREAAERRPPYAAAKN